MKKSIFILIVVALFYGGDNAMAEELKNQITVCSQIENNIKRLECYDKILKNNEETVSSSHEHWRVRSETSKLTDKINVFVSTDSIEPITNAYNQKETPSLILRCMDNKTELYVVWGMFLGSDSIKVTERIDKEKVHSNSWNISTDHKATFKHSPIEFIKALFDKQKLLLELTPYGESPRMVEFNVSGIEKIISPLQEACNWK